MSRSPPPPPTLPSLSASPSTLTSSLPPLLSTHHLVPFDSSLLDLCLDSSSASSTPPSLSPSSARHERHGSSSSSSSSEKRGSIKSLQDERTERRKSSNALNTNAFMTSPMSSPQLRQRQMPGVLGSPHPPLHPLPAMAVSRTRSEDSPRPASLTSTPSAAAAALASGTDSLDIIGHSVVRPPTPTPGSSSQSNAVSLSFRKSITSLSSRPHAVPPLPLPPESRRYDDQGLTLTLATAPQKRASLHEMPMHPALVASARRQSEKVRRSSFSNSGLSSLASLSLASPLYSPTYPMTGSAVSSARDSALLTPSEIASSTTSACASPGGPERRNSNSSSTLSTSSTSSSSSASLPSSISSSLLSSPSSALLTPKSPPTRYRRLALPGMPVTTVELPSGAILSSSNRFTFTQSKTVSPPYEAVLKRVLPPVPLPPNTNQTIAASAAASATAAATSAAPAVSTSPVLPPVVLPEVLSEKELEHQSGKSSSSPPIPQSPISPSAPMGPTSISPRGLVRPPAAPLQAISHTVKKDQHQHQQQRQQQEEIENAEELEWRKKRERQRRMALKANKILGTDVMRVPEIPHSSSTPSTSRMSSILLSSASSPSLLSSATSATQPAAISVEISSPLSLSASDSPRGILSARRRLMHTQMPPLSSQQTAHTHSHPHVSPHAYISPRRHTLSPRTMQALKETDKEDDKAQGSKEKDKLKKGRSMPPGETTVLSRGQKKERTDLEHTGGHESNTAAASAAATIGAGVALAPSSSSLLLAQPRAKAAARRAVRLHLPLAVSRTANAAIPASASLSSAPSASSASDYFQQDPLFAALRSTSKRATLGATGSASGSGSGSGGSGRGSGIGVLAASERQLLNEVRSPHGPKHIRVRMSREDMRLNRITDVRQVTSPKVGDVDEIQEGHHSPLPEIEM